MQLTTTHLFLILLISATIGHTLNAAEKEVLGERQPLNPQNIQVGIPVNQPEPQRMIAASVERPEGVPQQKRLTQILNHNRACSLLRYIKKADVNHENTEITANIYDCCRAAEITATWDLTKNKRIQTMGDAKTTWKLNRKWWCLHACNDQSRTRFVYKPEIQIERRDNVLGIYKIPAEGDTSSVENEKNLKETTYAINVNAARLSCLQCCIGTPVCIACFPLLQVGLPLFGCCEECYYDCKTGKCKEFCCEECCNDLKTGKCKEVCCCENRPTFE